MVVRRVETLSVLCDEWMSLDSLTLLFFVTRWFGDWGFVNYGLYPGLVMYGLVVSILFEYYVGQVSCLKYLWGTMIFLNVDNKKT